MASYKDKYTDRLNAYGNTIRSSRINSTINTINNLFSDSPSYTEVYFNNSTTSTGVQIVDDSEFKEQKVLMMKPGNVLNFGDKINWNSINWLTIIVDPMIDIYYRGTIRRCVDSIKWMDETGAIKEEPFYVTSELARGLGINQNNYLMMGDERRYISIQSNVDSRKLKKNQRFIFDNGRCWRLNAIDSLNTGLIYLTLDESQINDATDNIVLRVCDYVTHNYTLTITNGSSVSLSANSTLQLNTTLTDNGNIVSSPTLTYTSSNPTVASVNATGLVTALQNGTCTITVAMANDASVTAQVAVNVSAVVSDSYSLSITSTSATPSEIKNGQNKTYSVNVANNGVQITDGSQPVTWSLWDDTKTISTSLAMITSQSGTGCTVLNNNSTTGYVQLRCVLNSNNTIVTWQRIQMKSLT